MVKQTKNEKKKTNPFLWFLFAVIIPLMVAIGILFIILNVAGVDVAGWTKDKAANIPVLSSFISTEEDLAKEEDTEQIKGRIAEKDAEIAQLNEEIRGLESTIERLNQDIVKLENRNEQNADQLNEDEPERDTISSISGSFKDMDNEQAALILQNMDEETAISILNEVSDKVRGEILEAMDPETAANLTQLFIDS